MMNYKKIIVPIAVIIIVIGVVLIFFLPEESEDTLHATTDPFLWKIEGENPSYLYGSIHVGTEEVLTLPDVVYNAINNADAVYTEVKMDFSTQMLSLSYYLLPHDQTLEDLLPDDVENSLKSYLDEKNYAFLGYNSYKIWVVVISLLQIEYKEYYQISSLDKYVWNIAEDKGKTTNGLETYEEQLSIFDNLTIDEQIQFLNDSLYYLNQDIAAGMNSLELTINAYLEGDIGTLQDLEYKDYNKSDPLYDKLLTKILANRNHNMSERISDLITNNPDTKYFFTIGAAHFYGEDNIIQLLENEGYTITEVPFTKCSSCGCDNGEKKIKNRCYYPYDEEYSSLI